MFCRWPYLGVEFGRHVAIAAHRRCLPAPKRRRLRLRSKCACRESSDGTRPSSCIVPLIVCPPSNMSCRSRQLCHPSPSPPPPPTHDFCQPSLRSIPPGYCPDIVSFNTAIDACASREKWQEAVELLEVDMPAAKVMLWFAGFGTAASKENGGVE